MRIIMCEIATLPNVMKYVIMGKERCVHGNRLYKGIRKMPA